MEGQWASNGFVGTPDVIDDDRQDFFQLVPPTPNNNTHAQQQQQHAYTHPGFTHFSPPLQPHQLQLQQQPQHISGHSLRSNRSTSSFSSHSHWSTVGSETSEFDDDASSLATSFPASISPQLMTRAQAGSTEGQRQRRGPQRVPSLSIDPKLFAPQQKAGGEEMEEQEEMLETAKPRGKGKKVEQQEALGLGSPKKKGKDGGKKKVSHARKQNADHIPRPRNAFILFRKHVVDSKLIPTSVEMRHQNVSIITAKMWSEAPPDQKAHFNDLARIEKEEHMKKYPGYRYQPVYRRTNVIRRRVRKDEAEEEKCKNVAELLIKGKSGEELESEIREKISKGSEGEGSSSGRGSKATSRRGSAACELSKGALRALRAQARQRQAQPSGDWSDISRDTSIDPDSQSIRGRGSSLAFGGTTASESPEPRGMAYGYAGQEQGQGQYLSTSEAMAYAHPEVTSWAFEQGQEMGEQRFTYPAPGIDQRAPFQAGQSSHTQGYPAPGTSSQQFLYPQPQSHLSLPNQPQPQQQQHAEEFYAYDAALPFSPSANQFSFPQSQSHAQDYIAMAFEFLEPEPAHPPLSARWDRGHLLPPSSEVPLEGLPFDGGMMQMGDFEAALAHADDGALVGGVW
ncbi:hypothetical protein IAT38_001791 [Cryptococcus sp. DSM 104549]